MVVVLKNLATVDKLFDYPWEKFSEECFFIDRVYTLDSQGIIFVTNSGAT